MIRFACPGCNATYTVEDSKGLKAGKCPKCNAQFVIPAADAAAASPSPPPPPEPRRSPPPPPPPAPASDGAVEIKPCPKCGARLSVAASDLGVDVECPYCQAVYTAKRADAPERPSRREEPRDEDRPSRRRRDDDEEDRPSRRRAAAGDDEERPSRRRRDDDEDEDRPSRRRDEADDDEDDDDRPRRRKKRRRNYTPHRGVMILVFGILGFCCCIFSILAATMGTNDLREMDDGNMDPAGQTLTRVGQILGFVTLVLHVIGGIIRGILIANGK